VQWLALWLPKRCGKDAFGLEALFALPLYRTTTTA
jgi:hypothetical protein